MTTIKEKIFTTVQSLFAKEIAKIAKDAVDQKVEERQSQQDRIDLATVSRLVGQPVISVGNDWSNPVIGIGKEIQLVSKANKPYLVVHDFVSGTDVMPFGAVMDYDETRFEALMKLNPYEISSLVYRYANAHTVVDPEKMAQRESREVILEKLTTNGFFEKLKELKQVEQE